MPVGFIIYMVLEKYEKNQKSIRNNSVFITEVQALFEKDERVFKNHKPKK